MILPIQEQKILQTRNMHEAARSCTWDPNIAQAAFMARFEAKTGWSLAKHIRKALASC